MEPSYDPKAGGKRRPTFLAGLQARFGARAALLLLPLIGALLLLAIYSALFLRHSPFRLRLRLWRPVPREAVDNAVAGAAAAAAGRPPRDALGEWAVATALHRAAAAYCLASPACKLAILFTDGSDDPREEIELSPRAHVDEAAKAAGVQKVVPVVRLHASDEYAITAGPALVTCPSPAKEVWLVYAGARWAVATDRASNLAECAAAMVAAAGEDGLTPGAGVDADGSPNPHWVTCDWLLRLTKGDPIHNPSSCGFGPGSVAGLTRFVLTGSAPLALLRAGSHVLLYGRAPEVALVRRHRISEVAVFKGLPQPGDGLQAQLTLLVGAPRRDAAPSRVIVPPSDAVNALFLGLRDDDWFARPRALMPVLSFAACREWPPSRYIADGGGCGARAFTVFDHLLAVKNAVLLADWHRYRLVLPAMAPWGSHDEDGSSGGGGDGGGAELPAGALLDEAMLSAGLRGSVDVVDTGAFDPGLLEWSHRAVGLGGRDAADSKDPDGGQDLEGALHAGLKSHAGLPGKVHVDTCPVGAVSWRPRSAVHWHMPLRARMTSAMEPPPLIATLRSAFQAALRRQSGKPGYNAVDLRGFHAHQARCVCMLRAGDARLHEEAVNCGLGPTEVAHVLAGVLRFDPAVPLFVAVDPASADELLPALARAFSAVVTLDDLLPRLSAEGHPHGRAPPPGSPPPPLSDAQLQLLEGAIAEEATAFAGQTLSAMSFHVKERRAHRTEREAMVAADEQGAAAAEGLAAAAREAGGGSVLLGGRVAGGGGGPHRSSTTTGAWLPRQSAYLDRRDPRSCDVTSVSAVLVEDKAVRGGFRHAGTAGQYHEPCADEIALWLTA